MTPPASRLSIGFIWAGHTAMHLMSALYLTVVLALEDVWRMGYDDLIRLWTLGAFLIGLGAPLAGWLGDRWGHARMMVVFFLVMGAGGLMAGSAGQADALWLGLAVLGLGASIYHPVGMAWIVRAAHNPGSALGYQGIFGSLGVATAALTAGTLTDFFSWRAAFLVPGAVSVVLGLALALCLAFGWAGEGGESRRPQKPASRGDAMRAFMVLSATMLCGGLTFNTLQVVLPKWFELELGSLVGGSVIGVGGLVTVVYLLAAIPQVIGGHLADRLPVRPIYLMCFAAQATLLGAAAVAGGTPVLAVAFIMLAALNLQIPAENLLLTRFTPDRHRGLAFGTKFILTFGIGPVAVQVTALLFGHFGGFGELFMLLALTMAAAFGAALCLPTDRPAAAVQVAQGGE